MTVNDIKVNVDGLTESQRETLSLDADGRIMPQGVEQNRPNQTPSKLPDAPAAQTAGQHHMTIDYV